MDAANLTIEERDELKVLDRGGLINVPSNFIHQILHASISS